MKLLLVFVLIVLPGSRLCLIELPNNHHRNQHLGTGNGRIG